MEKKKRFNTKKLVMRTALTALTGIIVLAVTGCGEEMASIEQNQFELQKLIQADTHLMTDNMKRIEDSQSQLHVAMEDVQDTNKKQTNDVIAAIGQEHAALQDLLQLQRQRLTNSIAGIERSQRALQNGVESLNVNIQRVDESVVGHEQNLIKLQESLQNNKKDLANIIDVIGQRQLRFEERIQNNIQAAMVDTLKDVRQNQAGLQEQIAAMQDKNQVNNSKIIDTLEQMKATLSQIRAQVSSLSPVKNASISSETKK